MIIYFPATRLFAVRELPIRRSQQPGGHMDCEVVFYGRGYFLLVLSKSKTQSWP